MHGIHWKFITATCSLKKKKKKTWKRRREHTKPLKKKILVCILAKRVLILALKFIYLAPLPKKIYKLTQEIQQIDNKKNLYKKICSYPDNKKNLWTNHKFGLSKNNNNKSITNHSKKKNHKNLITFTLISPSHLRAPYSSQMTPPL